MAGTYVLYMPNGERIPIEIWVYQSWYVGELRDETLLAQFEQAEKINYRPQDMGEAFAGPLPEPQPRR